MAAQTIIVTGAGGGIGLAIVQQLLDQTDAGTLVVGVDIVGHRLEKLQLSAPEKLEIIIGDVAQRSTSEKAVQVALDRTGRIDTLILNAGILRPVGAIATTPVEQWKSLFDVNFFSLLHTIQLALPALRQHQGKIIMTSSRVANVSFRGWVAYACSKASMNHLCLALPADEPSVSAVCICPGVVDTGIQEQVRKEHKDDLPPEQYALVVEMKKKGQLLSPQQPASSFVKLALRGIPPEIRGKLVEWDDPHLKALSV